LAGLDEFRLLIMFVDERLAGLQAVQTMMQLQTLAYVKLH